MTAEPLTTEQTAESPRVESPRHQFIELLHLAGMVPELDRMSFIDDGGSDVPNPFNEVGQGQGVDEDLVRAKVGAALTVLAESKRPPPTRRIDRVEKLVSDKFGLSMDERVPSGSGVGEFLHNEDRLRAIGALLDIHARHNDVVDFDRLGEVADVAVNAVTVEDVEVWSPNAKRYQKDWYRAGSRASRGILWRRERREAEGIYTDRRKNARASLQEIHRLLGENEELDSFRAGYSALSTENRTHMAEILPTLANLVSGCRAIPIKMPDGRDAVRITASYTSERPVEDFIYPANPENWPHLNSNGFFKKVTTLRDTRQELSQLGDPRHRGFKATILEEVNLGDPSIKTELNVRFFVAPQQGPVTGPLTAAQLAAENRNASFVGMSFDFASSPDRNIDVDHGYLHVKRLDENRSLVEAAKTVRFTQLDNATSTYACLLGWGEAMKRMNKWWVLQNPL